MTTNPDPDKGIEDESAWCALLHGRAEPALRERARQARDDVFGRCVFVRGRVELSSVRNENRHGGAPRRAQRVPDRDGPGIDELADWIVQGRPATVTDLEIHGDADPVALREVVVPLVRALRHRTSLGLTLCLGTLSPREYDLLREAGADGCVVNLGKGDSNPSGSCRAPRTLGERLAVVGYLAGKGWHVSSGLVLGVPGQTPVQLEEALNLLTLLPLIGCSASPFVAAQPWADDAAPDGGFDQALNCVAWLRLHSPRWILSADSTAAGPAADGYLRALHAGANLVSLDLTPPLARTGHSAIDPCERVLRDEERLLLAIEAAGCEPSSISQAEHLRQRHTLAIGRAAQASKAASRALGPPRAGARP